MAQAQTYKNHRRYYWPHHFIVQPILIAHFLFRVRDFLDDRSWDNGWVALVAMALMMFAFTARAQALKAQNRSIRIEERLRLARLMPAEEQSKIDELSMSQLVGLRFASDEEVVDLARRSLSGELKTGGAVKKSVKTWRPDYHRV